MNAISRNGSSNACSEPRFPNFPEGPEIPGTPLAVLRAHYASAGTVPPHGAISVSSGLFSKTSGVDLFRFHAPQFRLLRLVHGRLGHVATYIL